MDGVCTGASLPRLSREEVGLACSFAKSRDLPNLGGETVRIMPTPAAIDDPVGVALAFACGPAHLTVPRALLHRYLVALDPAAMTAAAPWVALLVELALKDALAALAAAHPALAVTCTMQLSTTAPKYSTFLQIGAATCRLDMAAEPARVIAAALSVVPPRRSRIAGLPIRLHPRVLACSVSLGELRAANPGDVIPARGAERADVALLLDGGGLAWRARRDGDRLIVSDTVRRPGIAEREEWWMHDESIEAGADARLDDVPVHLSFELGRLELTLGELEVLGPGHVFELARAPADAVDILANGRRIGAGRVVVIGDAPAVQITRLGPGWADRSGPDRK